MSSAQQASKALPVTLHFRSNNNWRNQMKKLLMTALLMFTVPVAAAAEVPKALQGITWCNEYEACIVFSPDAGIIFCTRQRTNGEVK
jgi:hypothetical protein